MKNTIFGVFGLLFITGSIFAQVSPNPVADAEVRDSNSIRMRSLEFERVKRDANNPHPVAISKEGEVRFAVIKDDFENIQKLESAIVKAYTTGAKINYRQISASAMDMKKKAARLGNNFFKIGDETGELERTQYLAQKSVRDLIIELDHTLTDFVGSPIFKNPLVIDAKYNDKARTDLERLIKLSSELHEAAENGSR